MKVIDLLNKIANSEPIPYRIKYNENIYYYNLDLEWYIREDLKNELFIDRHHLRDNVEIINDVEIIEEPQENKIPEKLNIMHEKNIKNNWKWKVCGEEHEYNISTPQKIMADKINEILDYLKENK